MEVPGVRKWNPGSGLSPGRDLPAESILLWPSPCPGSLQLYNENVPALSRCHRSGPTVVLALFLACREKPHQPSGAAEQPCGQQGACASLDLCL